MRFLPASKGTCLVVTSLLFASAVSAQYKNDNVAFKTVYMEEFCRQFKSDPKAILLDVRSQGEYDDTSSSVSLNIGRLKPSTHIDIQELPARWHELSQYKEQPIYVMCSHSQRSRRASKMLADSGFTNIINVNGGMTTFNLLNMQKQCTDLYETSNQYKLVSPMDICSFFASNKNAFVLDVRSDSAFKGITDEKQRAYGQFKGSVNIPGNILSSSYSKIPKDRPILIVSDFGSGGAAAARSLSQNGFKNVNVLFNGLDAMLGLEAKDRSCITAYWEQNVPYKIVSPSEFEELAKKESNLQVVDVRPAEEFNNQSKTTWRNIGTLKNAINIPLLEIENKSTQLDKNKPLLVYHFSGPDAFAATRTLTNHGFSNVYVLNPGLFSVRWQAANLKGKSNLKDWVVNIPEENR